MKSAYDILGLNKGASDADIRAAFRQLALKHHPDKNPGDPSASKRFKEINEAYSLLKDPKRRAQYDKRASRPEFVRHPFEDLFGGRPFGAPPKRKLNKVRGRHVRLNCALELGKFWTGANFKFNICTKIECKACKCKGRVKCNKRTKCYGCKGRGVTRKRQGIVTFERTCAICKGSGVIATERCKKCSAEGRLVGKRSVQFSVRPGAAVNTTFKLENLGEAGVRGARAGHLYIRISVGPHLFYRVFGADLFCTLAAASETACLGGRLEFNTVVNTPLTLTIPSSTPADNLFVLRNRGLPTLQGGFGDLHIRLSLRERRTRRLHFAHGMLSELFNAVLRLSCVDSDLAARAL
ncbi:J domain-containing protein [Candidatus Hodgkinia cicadicola]